MPLAFRLDYVHLVALERNALKFPLHVLGAVVRYEALKGHIVSFVNDAALQLGVDSNVGFCLINIVQWGYKGYSGVVGIRVAI